MPPQLYAEVILPLPLDTLFTYSVPEEMARDVCSGSRVVVQFGKRKFYTAIVVRVLPSLPPDFAGDVKPLSELLDREPVVRRPQLRLWEWIAAYYMCSIGDVYRAAVPAGLKVESETFVETSPAYEEVLAEGAVLSAAESAVMNVLAHSEKKLTLADIASASGVKGVSGAVTSLFARGLAIVSEKLVERYHSVTEQYVELCATRGAAGEHSRLFALVKGAPKQERALLALIQLSGFMRPPHEEVAEVTRAALCEKADVTPAIVSTMAKKGVVRIVKKVIGRFQYNGAPCIPPPPLSAAQQQAYREIHSAWSADGRNVTLLHGVTASGKTEIYMHLIADALAVGGQALLLVPEIALTTQLTARLQRVFGEKVIIYHSKFSDNERVEIWRKLLTLNGDCVVVGARSAVFLPFANLRLVIVDEEHESSYKQHDPAPRYNGRDVAIVLAGMHGAKTLLGSATPTVATKSKALSGRFGHVALTERFGGVRLPAVEIVDLNDERKKGRLKGPFSATLCDQVNKALEAGRQAILFLNRRGYAPVAECKCCAHVPKCRDCDVSLTYHRRINRLVCHYCGAEYELPSKCPVCHEPAIEVHGYGTERLEEELTEAFHGRRILRMDLDTTRVKNGYDSIIDDFSRGRSDILVGTQMVTKGLDFSGVTVVGVVNADSMINLPDYRASERAFNMIEQVAGRAGRRDTEGHVVVQTRQPSHHVLRHVVAHDYTAFYNEEIEERRHYNYPPFTYLVNVYLRHRDLKALVPLSVAYGRQLRELFGTRVCGPEEPEVNRIQTYYIRKVMLKFELNVSMQRAKQLLRQAGDALRASGMEGARSLQIIYDVDPD